MLTIQKRSIRYTRVTAWVGILGFILFTFSGGSLVGSTAGYATNSSVPIAVSPTKPKSALTNNVVTEWNLHAAALSVLPASALSPVQQTRVMAIIQVAVHDAVNGISREYETYLSPGPAPSGASADAAAIAAAHHTLRNLFPTQSASLDTLYAASLLSNGIAADDPGIEYGESAAAAVLALRANDNSAVAQFDYIVPNAGEPGVWERLNNAPALLPGWGDVTPFVLNSSSQFSPEAPPARSSERYARDYNEIKQLGSLNGSTRTAEQTQIALFWRASPTAIWNPVLLQVVANRNLNLSETARTFALFYLAAADASIACWEAKYVHNFWRPMPAIRKGDLDGNDATFVDATWTPLVATPPHPEYPSGHTSNSGAMGEILELIFGESDGPLVVTIAGNTRQWSSFHQAVEEVIDARVYSGIHFRTADEVGARLGRQVARYVITHALRPCRGNGSRCA